MVRFVALLVILSVFSCGEAARWHKKGLRAVQKHGNATSTATKSETLELSPAGRKALRELLADLVAIAPDVEFGVKKLSESESEGEFLPRCKAHVQELVATIDAHYTDVQLKTVLTHECQLSQEFPHTHPSNFESHEACLKFADKLTEARMKELETGETGQYETFCKDYYKEAVVSDGYKAPPAGPEHEPAKKAEPEKKKSFAGHIVPGILFLLLSAVSSYF